MPDATEELEKDRSSACPFWGFSQTEGSFLSWPKLSSNLKLKAQIWFLLIIHSNADKCKDCISHVHSWKEEVKLPCKMKMKKKSSSVRILVGLALCTTPANELHQWSLPQKPVWPRNANRWVTSSQNCNKYMKPSVCSMARTWQFTNTPAVAGNILPGKKWGWIGSESDTHSLGSSAGVGRRRQSRHFPKARGC